MTLGPLLVGFALEPMISEELHANISSLGRSMDQFTFLAPSTMARYGRDSAKLPRGKIDNLDQISDVF